MYTHCKHLSIKGTMHVSTKSVILFSGYGSIKSIYNSTYIDNKNHNSSMYEYIIKFKTTWP